jgi:hypothetical protein
MPCLPAHRVHWSSRFSPPESYNGLQVQGSYGNVWVIQSDFVPEDYFAVVATYGPNSQDNVIGFGEHVQTQYRGSERFPAPPATPSTTRSSRGPSVWVCVVAAKQA